jgi:hypothetical protein
MDRTEDTGMNELWGKMSVGHIQQGTYRERNASQNKRWGMVADG